MSSPTPPPQEPSLEERKLALEYEKLQLERRRAKAEGLTKLAALVGLGIPLVLAALQFSWTQKADQKKVERELITRQLNELYYPLYWHAVQDDAVWITCCKLGAPLLARAVNEPQAGKGKPQQHELTSEEIKRNADVAAQITKFLPANHEKILAIIDSHPELLRNGEERDEAVEPFVRTLQQYRTHVAVLLALRAAGDARFPYDLPGHPYPYPDDLSTAILNRIKALERQRQRLASWVQWLGVL